MNVKRNSLSFPRLLLAAIAALGAGIAAANATGCECHGDSTSEDIIFHLHIVDAATGKPVAGVEYQGDALDKNTDCEELAEDGNSCLTWLVDYEFFPGEIGAPGYISRPLPRTRVRTGWSLSCAGPEIDAGEATLELEAK